MVVKDKVNYDSASDTDVRDNILNIGRRRERAIYYRQDGTPTALLPADPYSKMYYMSKGFTMSPGGKKVVEKPQIPEGVVALVLDGKIHCPLCTFKAENALGLRSHLRVHVNKEKEEGK